MGGLILLFYTSFRTCAGLVRTGLSVRADPLARWGRPATGESAKWRVTHIFTLRDGRIVADATVVNRIHLMEQLGQPKCLREV